MFHFFFYNFAIRIYKFLTIVASLFNKKAKQRIVGLRNNEAILRKIKQEKATSKNWQLAWFHAASLGEFEQARPVLEEFKNTYPAHKILVTFFSPSGYEIRKNYPLADFILYLPFDLPADAEEFIDSIQPTIVFWVKYEYWRNFLKAFHRKSVTVYLFSAIFRENQPFFRWYAPFFVQPLKYFSHLFVQDNNSKYLLSSIGIENVTVAGDTRFDRVADTLTNVREIEIMRRFKSGRQLLVLGSAWEEDVACIAPIPTFPQMGKETINSIPNEGKVGVVIAPHELHEEELERWKVQFNGIRYSEVTEETDLSQFQTLIIDNIGLLSSIYQYADFAFIGGGFGKGLHNILEAATFGMPVFFGNKNYKKFKEAADLVELGGAFAVKDAADFKFKFKAQFTDNQLAARVTSEYVQRKTGATKFMLDWLGNQNL